MNNTRKNHYRRKNKSNRKIKSKKNKNSKTKKLRKVVIKKKNLKHIDRAQKKQDILSSYKLFIYN